MGYSKRNTRKNVLATRKQSEICKGNKSKNKSNFRLVEAIIKNRKNNQIRSYKLCKDIREKKKLKNQQISCPNYQKMSNYIKLIKSEVQSKILQVIT